MSARPRVVLAITACVFFAALNAQSQDKFHFDSPILRNTIYAAVNGERSGYIEAELTSSRPVYAQNVDPGCPTDALLKATAGFHVGFLCKVETVDGNGKKQSRKVARFLRAGPGEQIALAFAPYDHGAFTSVSITLFYYDDSANLLGETAPVTFGVADNQYTSTVVTFTRGDLRR